MLNHFIDQGTTLNKYVLSEPCIDYNVSRPDAFPSSEMLPLGTRWMSPQSPQTADTPTIVEFRQLLARAASGEQTAAVELVQMFEPEIRRFIRFRLANSRLRQFLDSLDICQSVLGQFFVELDKGALELQSPDQLRGLLLKIAKNRFLSKVRYQQAARRDVRRHEPNPHDQLPLVAQAGASPEDFLESQELSALIRARLPEETRYLVEQRMNGKEWAELAAEIGLSPEAARKRMARALDEVAEELGLIEAS